MAHDTITLTVNFSEQGRALVAKAAELRGVSIKDYVRIVTVAQAQRELDVAEQNTIALTPDEQLAFWNALNAAPQLTEAQRELGRTMRGEK